MGPDPRTSLQMVAQNRGAPDEPMDTKPRMVCGKVDAFRFKGIVAHRWTFANLRQVQRKRNSLMTLYAVKCTSAKTSLHPEKQHT